MEITMNRNVSDRICVHMTTQEYMSLQDMLRTFLNEHSAGDGACSVSDVGTATWFADTCKDVRDVTDTELTGDEIEKILDMARTFESEHGGDDMTAMILLKLEETIKQYTEMDIGSQAGYPAGSLSNFAPHPFVIDGVECNSMEGFLQSLKFKEPDMQRYVCTLVGKKAKFKGKPKKWYLTQTLYWQGREIKRDSDEYQELLDRAYDELAKNTGFQNALLATGNATLTHSIGKKNRNETVLTTQEFCSRLTRIRARLQETKKSNDRKQDLF